MRTARVGGGGVTVQALPQTEKQFMEAVIEYARRLNWLVYHTHTSKYSEAGYPDLTLVRGDRLVFAELKTERGRVSVAQERWLDALRRATTEVWLWRPRDWPEIEDVLR